MPLEIKELVIRATVQEQDQPTPTAQRNGGHAAEQKEAIIEECVDKVLEILRNKNER